MLRNHTIGQIRELLAAGASQRAVARQAGVSRGLVADVYHGRRTQRPEPTMRRGADRRPASGPEIRCSVCRRKVRVPCLACALRRLSADERLSLRGGDDGPLLLDLQAADRARYEEVRFQRAIAAANASFEAPQWSADDGDDAIEILDNRCPCGQPLTAVIHRGVESEPDRVEFFSTGGGKAKRVRRCPTCGRQNFFSQSADQLKATAWAS